MSFGSDRVVPCAECGALSTFPFPSPDRILRRYRGAYYAGADAARFRSRAAERLMRFFRRRRARAIERKLGAPAGRRILDVGCGRGYTLSWLQRRGADVHGTQISEAAAAVARNLIGADRVFVGDLGDARYETASFDCVMLWHVLEHIADPLALLREVTRVLKPDGFAYIEVPNAGGWSARTLGRHWLAYDVPNHLFHFTPDLLNGLTSRAGLTKAGETHFSLEYSPATLLQSALNASLGGDSLLFRWLSHEGVAAIGRVPRVRLAFHMAAAAIAAPASVAASWVLAMLQSGDTYGAYFVRTSAAELKLRCHTKKA